MTQFFHLPRELRDKVYTEILMTERPTPSLGGAQWMPRFRAVFEAQSSERGDYGCAYSLEKPPETCANFLQCNRQIYTEMTETIWRVKKKGPVPVKLDCMAENENMYYFTWLAIPLVETSGSLNAGRWSIIPIWADRMIRRYSAGFPCQRSTTLISQLWVDVRLVASGPGMLFRNASAPECTPWAICAALKRIVEKGPDFASFEDAANETTIDELVLNVVTRSNVTREESLAGESDSMRLDEEVVQPETMARELVNVWQDIWSGGDQGRFYQTLLHRIKRVRVCIDGKTWKRRELKLELERGHKALQRRSQRTGR